jgi:hypothetical protein
MARQTRKRVSHRLPEQANTLHGLHHWHKHLFEHLGWMVLAKAKGHKDKVAQYKKSIQRFLKSVDHVSEEYESRNRKHDLHVLRMHVEELERAVSHCL